MHNFGWFLSPKTDVFSLSSEIVRELTPLLRIENYNAALRNAVQYRDLYHRGSKATREFLDAEAKKAFRKLPEDMTMFFYRLGVDQFKEQTGNSTLSDTGNSTLRFYQKPDGTIILYVHAPESAGEKLRGILGKEFLNISEWHKMFGEVPPEEAAIFNQWNESLKEADHSHPLTTTVLNTLDASIRIKEFWKLQDSLTLPTADERAASLTGWVLYLESKMEPETDYKYHEVYSQVLPTMEPIELGDVIPPLYGKSN